MYSKIPEFKINKTQKVKGYSDGIRTLAHKLSAYAVARIQGLGLLRIKAAKPVMKKILKKYINFFILSPMYYFIKIYIALVQGECGILAKRIKLEKTKKKEKWNLFTTEKPIDSENLKGAHTEIFSRGRVVIEGCLGVYEYNDTYLKLRLIKGAVIISGTDFSISAFESGTITVNGKISTLEFCD